MTDASKDPKYPFKQRNLKSDEEKIEEKIHHLQGLEDKITKRIRKLENAKFDAQRDPTLEDQYENQIEDLKIQLAENREKLEAACIEKNILENNINTNQENYSFPLLADEIVEIQYDVECKYQGYPEPKPILVRNTVQMFLEDIGKYRLAQINDLEIWVKSKLEKIVKPSLIYKEYIDILLDFEPIALQIKQDMEKEVKIIGYNVRQIVSRPNLKLLEIIKSFYLEIEEEIFATKDANVKVKLNILVSGKIEEPRKIKDYLNPDSDIEGLMKRTVSNAVRDVLNTIEPERYYLRFCFPAVDEITGKAIEKSVEQELTDKIKEALEKDFYAKLSTIISKPLNTEITEKYQELFRQIGKFEFELPSLKSDEPPVQFQGDFQIDGIEKDSWYIFQSRLPSINDIRQSIATSLKAKLMTFDDEILQYRDTENLLILENFINEWINKPLARDSITNQFGLKISINISILYSHRGRLL